MPITRGCTPIPSGTQINYTLRDLNSGKILAGVHTLNRSLYQFRTFNINVDGLGTGFANYEIVLKFDDDKNPDNNDTYLKYGKLENSTVGYLEEFEFQEMDTAALWIYPSGADTPWLATWKLQPYAGQDALVLGGGNIYKNDSSLRVRPIASATFFERFNEPWRQTLQICFDPQNYRNPVFSFDVAMNLGDENYDSLRIKSDFAAMVRVSYTDDSSFLRLDTIFNSEVSSDHFTTYDYFIPNKGITGQIELNFMTLSGTVDLLTGEIQANSDIVAIDNLRIWDAPVSTSDLENTNWKMHPNPTADYLMLDMGELKGPFLVEIYNLSGQLIQKERFESERNEINLGQIRSGLYSVRLWNGLGEFVGNKKLMVVK